MLMRSIPVDADYHGSRLDRFLKEKCLFSQGILCKYLRKGLIKIDGAKAKFNTRLSLGNEILISEFIFKEDVERNYPENKVPLKLLDLVGSGIIYEDHDFLVLNKPYGLSVQGGEGVDFAVIDILKALDRDCRIVHRLDKNTSGVMLFAKNKVTAGKISGYFRDHVVKKAYVAVLCGVPEDRSGVIESKIRKIPTGNESFAMNCQDGDEAFTRYEVLDCSEKLNLSLVKFLPVTGRIHQIRLHALKLGCPILGDEKYNPKYNKSQKLHLVSALINLPDGLSFTLEYFPPHIEQTVQLHFPEFKIKSLKY